MSLLEATRGLIERTYGTATGIGDLAPFILGDRGYRKLAGRHQVVRRLGGQADVAGMPVGPRVLVRQEGDRTALSIYFPDTLILRLEADPPMQRLHDGNVDDFAHFVEEVDHFVLLAHGLAHGREVNLLELEIRANLTKALVLFHFIGRHSGRVRLALVQRLWVHHHLFEKDDFAEEDGHLQRRYVEARRLAVRLLSRLEGLAPRLRLAELRRWNELAAPLKLRELAAG